MGGTNSHKETIANGMSAAKSEANPFNKRRSLRVVIDVSVSVFGQDSAGKIFEEKTKSISVSAHGGLITLKTDIDSQKQALLVNPKTGTEIQCRIVHRKEIEKGLFEIGVEFASPLPRFWGINFPPDDWVPADRKKHNLSHTPIPTLSKGNIK